MTWFKVDDKLPRHRKARAVRRSHPAKRRDAAPFGIWALAGAESDDGFIALEVLLEWDDDAEALAARLVAAGLWWETEQDGEPGYGFHDWQDYVPRPGDIEDAAESGRRGNHVRWHEKRALIDPECPFCCPDDRGDASGRSGRDRDPNREPVPSRPDPTRPDHPSRSREQETPERFEEFWTVYDHKVGRRKAEVAYRSALRKTGVTADLLIAAAGEYVAWVKSEGKHPQFTKHPTTWLNGEHWRDERAARQQPLTRVQQHLALAQQLANEGATVHQLGGDR